MKQHKPWVTTLVLVGIAAALAAYIFLVEAKREPPPEQQEGTSPTPAPLWALKADDLIEITVARGEQTTTVVRSDGEWLVTAPEESEADGARVDGVAFQVVNMESTRALADVGDLADFGLEEPEIRVTLVLSDATTVNLAIGDENPRHTARYVQKEGDPLVYLVFTSSVNGLIELVDNPPYPPTPVPTPSPVETLTPTDTPEPTP